MRHLATRAPIRENPLLRLPVHPNDRHALGSDADLMVHSESRPCWLIFTLGAICPPQLFKECRKPGLEHPNVGPAPLQKCVGDFCAVNLAGDLSRKDSLDVRSAV